MSVYICIHRVVLVESCATATKNIHVAKATYVCTCLGTCTGRQGLDTSRSGNQISRDTLGIMNTQIGKKKKIRNAHLRYLHIYFGGEGQKVSAW